MEKGKIPPNYRNQLNWYNTFILQEKIILEGGIMENIKIIFNVLVILFIVYNIMQSIRHHKEQKMLLKDKKFKTYLGKANREYNRYFIIVIILIILSTLQHFLF
ncbi:hypothetical protein [Gottfriedia acidiceleris]|uniref:hypothetical protein n=1 Tax=Gottfriedia acidiceleris TaxID=371036 RepID=UPI003D241CF4